MWSLKHPSTTELTDYKQLLLSGLKDRIETSQQQNIIDILLPGSQTAIIENLLIYKPQELYDLNYDLMSQLIPGYNENEFEDYLHVKSKKEETLYKKYYPTLNLLLNIFNYEEKISRSKSKSYKISKIKARNSCTYCNRQYTQHIIKNKGKNDKERITRPQLDHWFAKSLFPLMSLSFYNLIPSCSICNSGAKGESIFMIHTHIHPYIETDSNPNFSFSYKAGVNGEWNLIINKGNDPKVKKTIEAFHLEDIYYYHSNLELKDIMDFSIANNDTYLNTLFNQIMIKFPEKKKEDIYRMLFGTELKSVCFLDRPMSKLKYDILKKLGVIEKIMFDS